MNAKFCMIFSSLLLLPSLASAAGVTLADAGSCMEKMEGSYLLTANPIGTNAGQGNRQLGLSLEIDSKTGKIVLAGKLTTSSPEDLVENISMLPIENGHEPLWKDTFTSTSSGRFSSAGGADLVLTKSNASYELTSQVSGDIINFSDFGDPYSSYDAELNFNDGSKPLKFTCQVREKALAKVDSPTKSSNILGSFKQTALSEGSGLKTVVKAGSGAEALSLLMSQGSGVTKL